MLMRVHTPRSLLSWGSPPFWYEFTPFWHVTDCCAPDRPKNTAGGRLFQLVVVVARRKTTYYVETTNGPANTLKRDQHP